MIPIQQPRISILFSQFLLRNLQAIKAVLTGKTSVFSCILNKDFRIFLEISGKGKTKLPPPTETLVWTFILFIL